MTDSPPQPGQPQYGPPGQPPQYGPPGQPQYGPPGQPQYGPPGQPQYGPPPGPPPQGGFPPGPGGPGFPPGPGGPGGFPPGPGGPGFGPYGPPPGRNNKLPWIIGAALAAVAAIAVVLVLVMGGGSKSSNSPKDVADRFFKADTARNIKGMQDLSCEPLLSRLKGDASDSFGDKSYKLGDAKENGDSAQVGVNVVDPDGHADDIVLQMNKQDGKWKICDIAKGTVSGGGGSPGASTDTAGGQATGVPTGLPTDFPTGLPTDIPTDLPTGGGTGSFCVTPNGSSPICIPQ